jgi:hypothetical protein
MDDESTREELEKIPVSDEARESLWARDELERDRLITFQTGYWYTLASLHGLVLSAASIVSVIQPNSPKWLFMIISALSIIGLTSIAMSFQLMRRNYEAGLLHSSDLKSMAALEDHYKKQQQRYPIAGKLKKRRQNLERVGKWTAAISVICLVCLVLTPQITCLFYYLFSCKP